MVQQGRRWNDGFVWGEHRAGCSVVIKLLVGTASSVGIAGIAGFLSEMRFQLFPSISTAPGLARLPFTCLWEAFGEMVSCKHSARACDARAGGATPNCAGTQPVCRRHLAMPDPEEERDGCCETASWLRLPYLLGVFLSKDFINYLVRDLLRSRTET